MSLRSKRKQSNVASLFGAAPIGQPTVCPDVVDRLEGLLKQARDGHLHSIAYAAVDRAGSTITGWCGKAEAVRTEAAVMRLFARIAKASTED